MSLFEKYNAMSISSKLVAFTVGSLFLSGTAIGTMSYYTAKNDMLDTQAQRVKLTANRSAYIAQSFFNDIDKDLENQSKSQFIKEYMPALSGAWSNLTDSDKTVALQARYSSSEILKPSETSENNYDVLHEAMHKVMKSFRDQGSYYDIFLVNPQGDVIYTVAKEKDFATNLNSGPWSNTGLSNTFKKVMSQGQNLQSLSLTDFAPYKPSKDEMSGFAGKPILDDKNQVVGAIIVQFSADKLSEALKITSDKMKTTAYLVGEDGKLRSKPSPVEGVQPIGDAITPEFIQEIENSEDFAVGAGVFYPQALIDLAPLKVGDYTWYAATESDYSLVENKLFGNAISSLLMTLGGIAAFSVLSWMYARSFSRPVEELVDVIDDMTQGKQVHIPGENRKDELGNLARSLNKVYDAALEAKKIQTAIENSHSMIMIIDNEFKIVYTNRSLADSLNRSPSKIRSMLGGKDISGLKGMPFESFDAGKVSDLKNRAMSSSGKVGTSLKVDDRIFQLSLTSIVDASGGKQGYVVEWLEKTQELMNEQQMEQLQELEEEIERQVAQVILSVSEGNFAARLNIDDKRPFIQAVSGGINQLCSIIEQFMNEMGGTLEAIADGDLTRKLNSRYNGRFEEMKNTLNHTMEKLSGIISEIAQVEVVIQKASHDISHGAEDLSNRTEAQAASIEETVATMEEMSASVRMNADNAQKANDLSREALHQAEKGGQVVHSAVSAMSQLESGSVRITEIVGVIDSIASQTNLLALNAAVEAARAGEAGKGFAVVASEVRSLASRCSEAARDIRQLITQSNGQVSEGVKLVNATGDALSAIVSAVSSVAQTIAAISSASREQATGVDEITQSINNMDQMTQQNASLSDESATAARNMSQQVQNLSQLVRQFKTGSLASLGYTMKAEQQSMMSSMPKSSYTAKKSSTSKSMTSKPKVSVPAKKVASGGSSNPPSFGGGSNAPMNFSDFEDF